MQNKALIGRHIWLKSLQKTLLVMKLAAIFLLIGTLQVNADPLMGQTINMHLKNTEVKKALKTIERDGYYRFAYNATLEGLKQKKDISFNNTGIEEAMKLLLNGTNMTYKLAANNLVLVLPAYSNENTALLVTGRVTDENGQPVGNVSVTEKGTTNGTSTDANGNYTINAAPNATLVFSSIGYETQSVAVNNRNVVDVSLNPAVKKIDEVIVVGYGSQRKIDVTGSVTQIKGNEISKQASSNVLSALQGKVAGVQITNSGAPGSAPQINIRGVGTVYGNTNPLFVVDGVWYDDISFINASDIESMSVLKDASSESIYGIRAANGVILVTTKKGRQNAKAVANYNGFVGTQVVTNQINMVNGPQYAQLINELDVLNGSAGRYTNPTAFGTTDWYHQILRTAMVTNHQVSITGGGDKSNYNVSLGYYHQDGLVKTNNYDRYTVHVSNDIHLSKAIKFGVNTTASLSKSKDMPGGIFYELFNAAPIVPVYYADGAYGDAGDYNIATANQKNPQASVDFFDQNTKTWKLNGNIYGDLKFLKYFTFHSSIGGDFSQAETNNYTHYTKYNSVPVAYRNDFTALNRNRGENRNWIIENTLTYDRKFGDHSFKILAGQGAQEYKFYGLNAYRRGVPDFNGGQYFALGSDTMTVSDAGSINRVASYFGRINYAFADKYMVTASLRADGSSKFSNNWGYFPSIGLGWVISNEKFMESQQIFNNLKLRGSWGKIGNMSVPANLSVLTASQTGQLVYVGGDGTTGIGASINSVVTPKTDWELGEGIDIGLEASMLDNRLYAEIDWYSRKTKNAIFDIPVLGSVGTSSGTIIGNQANFLNKGIELVVSWKDDINKDWHYTVSANAGFNKNKVSSVSTGGNPIYQYLGTSVISRTMAGQPIGQFYGRQVVGIFQSAADIANYKNSGGTVIQPGAKPGDFKFKDVNDDGAIDDKDRVILGNPNPRMVYGINTTVGYKNFDLTLDFQGVSGIEIYNGNFALRFGGENYTKDYYDNRWHGEGTSNTYPSVATSGNSSVTSSFYVENGSYFRVRNAQLGYTFSGLKRTGISKLRMYVNAQNPFTWFHYRGFTPEVPASSPSRSGIDQQVHPLYATYNFGVNLTF